VLARTMMWPDSNGSSCRSCVTKADNRCPARLPLRAPCGKRTTSRFILPPSVTLPFAATPVHPSLPHGSAHGDIRIGQSGRVAPRVLPLRDFSYFGSSSPLSWSPCKRAACEHGAGRSKKDRWHEHDRNWTLPSRGIFLEHHPSKRSHPTDKDARQNNETVCRLRQVGVYSRRSNGIPINQWERMICCG
jgi:hypothetical protein